MKKKFEEMPMCGKGHDKNVAFYCTKCEMWVCEKCKESHMEHEGLLKDFEELTNQHIQIYAEHMRHLKSFFRKLEQTPTDTDYDDAKAEILIKINAAYEQLVGQLYKHRDSQIKRISDYIEHTKRKRQKLKNESQEFDKCVELLQKTLTKLKKCNVNKIPKEHLLKYNNLERVRFHEEGIEAVKQAVERCSRVREQYLRLRSLEIKVQVKDAYFAKMVQIPSNLKEEPRLLLVQPKSRNVIVANLETMRKRLVTVGEKSFRLPQYFEFVSLKNKVILCGGSSETEKCTNNTYEISVDSGDVRELADMQIAKKYHSLCVTSSTSVYSVGGLGSSGVLKTCEMLDMSLGQWTMQCPLNEPREGPTTSYLANKFLYCIGGRESETNIFGTLEVMDTTFPKLGWSLVPLQTDVFKPVYFGLSWPLDSKRILIAGGMTVGQIPLARSYILDVETYEIKEIKSLHMPDCFLERDKTVYHEKLYAIAYASYAIHIFDTKECEWNIIKSTAAGPTSEERKSVIQNTP